MRNIFNPAFPHTASGYGRHLARVALLALAVIGCLWLVGAARRDRDAPPAR